MTQSKELADLLLELYQASVDGELSFFEELISEADGVTTIGSDPQEFWEGREAILEARSRSGAIGAIEPGAIRAFAEGSVGWVVDRPRLRLQDGSTMDLRLSAIFHREEGRWMLVHQHVSTGVSDPIAEASARREH